MDQFDLFYSPTYFGAESLSTILQALSALQLVNSAALPTVTLHLKFEDGTTVDLHIQKSGKPKLDPGTARDSNNNNVPYLGRDGKAHDLAGDHEYGSSGEGQVNRHSFLGWLGLHRIAVYYGGNVPPSGSGGGCVVTEDSDGHITNIQCQQF